VPLSAQYHRRFNDEWKFPGITALLVLGKCHSALHLTRPRELIFAAHLRAVVVTGVEAGQVSFMFGGFSLSARIEG
jgi:hypothetical protein